MRHPALTTAAWTALLAGLPAAQAGMYTKNSPVIQLDARSYERSIAKSNYTWIVEFYAPWCGHCQSLKPAYEKAATNLEDLAKVAAMDCDDDANKPMCGSMGVQGFPTLKIVRPTKTPGGKPVVEDYQGPRTAKSIVEAVASKINNHVARVTDKDLDAFVAGDKPKAILFSEKGATSALLRSIAIDFLDVISVAQIRDKEKAAVGKFGIEKYPTLVLLPGGGKEPITYTGELNKKAMVDFLSQVGQPNADPAPADANKDKKKKGEKGDKKKTKKSTKDADKAPGKKASDKETSDGGAADKAESGESSTTTTTENAAQTHDIIPIATITANDVLVEKCLRPKSHTCILALVPSGVSELGDRVVASLAQLNTKYVHGKRHLFPFFSVPSQIEGTSSLRSALELSADVELVALNARRGWWRRYEGDFGVESVEGWVDAIRMGDGKNELPKKVVVEKVEVTDEQSSTEPSETTEATEGAETTESTEGAETKTTETTDSQSGEETETPPPKSEEKVVHEEL